MTKKLAMPGPHRWVGGERVMNVPTESAQKQLTNEGVSACCGEKRRWSVEKDQVKNNCLLPWRRSWGHAYQSSTPIGLPVVHGPGSLWKNAKTTRQQGQNGMNSTRRHENKHQQITKQKCPIPNQTRYLLKDFQFYIEEQNTA